MALRGPSGPAVLRKQGVAEPVGWNGLLRPSYVKKAHITCSPRHRSRPSRSSYLFSPSTCSNHPAFPRATPSNPLLSTLRSFLPSSREDDHEESSYLNAICYPDAALDDTQDEFIYDSRRRREDASCDWPQDQSLVTGSELLPLIAHSDVLPVPLDSVSGSEASSLAQQVIWRRAAAAAVISAEDNYRRAWKDLQRAEKLLRSTRKVAAELGASADPQARADAGRLDGGLWSCKECVEGADSRNAGSPAAGSRSGASGTTVDLGWNHGVWCIEACGTEPELHPSYEACENPVTVQTVASTSTDADDASISDALIDAEGAISRSRVALDKAACDLVARLQEEKDLQARIMDHHIEVLDQGAQHQVARWLVDEMDAAVSRSEESEGSSEVLALSSEDSAPIAVPLDLDLAMRGYDEHAVRFLRHLPYDQVLKIRTIHPSEEAKAEAATLAAAATLERILSQPSGQPASLPSADTTNYLRDSRMLLEGRRHRMEVDLDEGEDIFESLPRLGSGGGLAADNSSSLPVTAKGEAGGQRKRGKYHSKLVLLGCAVSTLAAYMVANFDLLALAKDVSVILTAMSLAFMAAQFVWKSGSKGKDLMPKAGQVSTAQRDEHVDGNKGEGHEDAHVGGMTVGRSPTWDQVIWLIGACAVVLSLSTMVALACKAIQAGLKGLSMAACALVIKVLPQRFGGSAASVALVPGWASLVQQVSTSLWLVVGGGILSSGVESLGSAAAWAMLLLCVAFSIASAPVCIASSTSRRVSELLALARSR